MNLAVELLALCAYGPALVLAHEAGHAAFARRGGFRVTSFAVGLGTPLWSMYLRDGVVLHIDRWVWAGGACTAIPIGPPTARRAWFHGGGLLVQSALALGLWVAPDGWLVDRLFGFNLLVAATNALPWRWRGQASDGWHVIDAWAGGARAAPVIAQRAQLSRMLEREREAHSSVGVAYCDVCLAWSEVQLGLLDAAADRIADEDPQLTREPWVSALYHMTLADWHRASGRPHRAVEAAQAGRVIDGLDPDGLGLLDLAEARAWVDVGDRDRARSALSRLVGSTGAVAHQAAATLMAASLREPTADLEMALWRVERRLPDAWLDPLDVVRCLTQVADELARRDRPDAARGARASADRLFTRTVAQLGIREQAWAHARYRPS
jgi:hypothetical protein